MKKRYILFGILISFIFLMPLASAIEESVYLYTPGTSSGVYRRIYQPILQQGDKIYWRFTTYDDEFEVLLIIRGTTVSEGKTVDSGIYDVQNDGILQINFLNDDLEWFRSGWIDIEININEPLPDDEVISSHNLLFLVCTTLGTITICVLIVISRRLKSKIEIN